MGTGHTGYGIRAYGTLNTGIWDPGYGTLDTGPWIPVYGTLDTCIWDPGITHPVYPPSHTPGTPPLALPHRTPRTAGWDTRPQRLADSVKTDVTGHPIYREVDLAVRSI